MARCGIRHWFAFYGWVGSSSPVCRRCGAPNPHYRRDDDPFAGKLVEKAIDIATRAHETQTRIGGEPYINHPRRVAEAVLRAGGDEAAVIAAWLHDVVEDSETTLEDLRKAGFSQRIVDAVDSVTRRPGEEYFAMIRRARDNPIGRLVKWHDNLDNSSEESTQHLAPARRAFSAKRYAKARQILMEDQ